MMRSTSGRLLNQGLSIFRASRTTGCIESQKFIAQHRLQSTIQQHHAQANETDKCSTFTPEEGFIRNSPYDPFTPTDLTLDKYVWQEFQNWHDKIATVCVVTGRQYTYAQLRDHSAALAVRLQKKFKLNTRDVLAVCLPNLPEYPIAVFGSLEAGLIVTTVNPIYTAEEIARQLTSSNAKIIIGTTGGYNVLKEACAIAKRNVPIVCIKTSKNDSLGDGAIDFFELISTNQIDFSELKPHDITRDDMVFLPYSSGTTGLPKGVMLSHKNITSNCEMVQTNSPYQNLMLETVGDQQDVTPCLLPFFHIYGLTICMISKIKLGCKLVTIPRFTPDDLIKSLYDYKGTVLNLVPPIVLFLTNSPKVEKKHLENLRVVMSGAAPIGALDAEKLIAKYPKIDFVQGYGLTETSPVVIVSHKGCKKYASVGFVTPGTQAKIVTLNDPKSLGLGPNQTGELWVRGPQCMEGYLNNKEATKDMLVDGNWLRTGDVGYYDEEGYFFITDRMKELIKVKGFQVPPAELEELLRDHPKLVDAAVIGIPHEQFGEAPRAFVVLKPGSEATEKEIQDFIADKVAVYKKLEGGVAFVKEIPKTASGKILRRELKEKYC